MTVAAPTARAASRHELQRWSALLDQWLLPGAFYGAVHTWPLLYRSDGDGRSFVVADGDRLLSHCALRVATLRRPEGAVAVALLGSVCTDPAQRGRGLATAALDAALRALDQEVAHCVLWAERPELYARAGFRPGPPETCLWLARRPRPQLDGVRPLTHADHAAVHALHHDNPSGIERSPAATSCLLSTPGTTTLVLERGGEVAAYACCGKGADLQGHWHDLGGTDGDLALLLPAALHLAGQTEAALLLPPYRSRLRALLGAAVVGEAIVPGPMVRSTGDPLGPCWIDGLDSV